MRPLIVDVFQDKPKWFKTDKELKVGDLVYFRKKESALEGKWAIGVVDDIERALIRIS